MTTQEGEDAETKSLGGRMKKYEESTTSGKILPNTPFIIRLDGHKFSTFTKPFRRPYDERFAAAMLVTAEKLLLHFNAYSVYTCSDEITLVFPACQSEEQQVMHNGKVSKITTLSASYASVCFDRALKGQTFDPVQDARLIEHLESSVPHFDSRVFNLPNDEEVLNNLVWRCHYDCVRNSVSGLAAAYMTQRERHAISKDQLLAILKEKHNVDWHEMNPHFKYGTLFKREQFEMEARGRDGEKVVAMRSRVVGKSFDITFSPENVKLVMDKYTSM
jgi:tRNA(His) guanylyltransferase